MGDLLRYQLFLSIGVIFLSIWKAALSNLDYIKESLLPTLVILGGDTSSASTISSHSHSDAIIDALVTYLPLWTMLSLGVYALLCVLYRVATFGDCPDAADELGGQINEAKVKLKTAGFAF